MFRINGFFPEFIDPEQSASYREGVADGRRAARQSRAITLIPPGLPEAVLGRACGVLSQRGHALLLRPDWPPGVIRQIRRQVAATAPQQLRNMAPEGGILIATGGSSGTLRFALHTPESLGTAAQPVLRYATAGNPMAVTITLPVDHVSGWMPFIRALISGGSVLIHSHLRLPPETRGRWISLVPTQLARLLRDPDALGTLATAGGIFLGGAPPDKDALERAAGLPLHLTYGMTETAGMIAAVALRDHGSGPPAAFVLPEHRVHLQAPDNRITIESGALAVAIWPGLEPLHQPYPTDDRGRWTRDGRLEVLGRIDRTIISGGENIDPGRIEALLLGEPGVRAVRVLGLPDAEWGQRTVCLCVAPGLSESDWAAIEARMARHLPRRWLPKRVFLLDHPPVDTRGKWSVAVATREARWSSG